MQGKKAFNRKDFIKSTFSGAAGFAFLGAVDARPVETTADQESSNKKIIYRILGKTGIKLPIVSMGVQQSSNPALVRAALDAGIMHFDTAYIYQRGRNEEMIGEMIKGRPRDSFVIGTKIRRRRSGTDDQIMETFAKQFDLSLERLGLDQVDILYLHDMRSVEHALSEPYLRALRKAKEEGKTRFVGVSTHINEPEIIRAAIDSKFYDVVLTAYNHRQDHHAEVRAAIAKAAQAGLGVIAMKVFAGGPAGTTYPAVAVVNARASLKWVLQDPNVHTTIPGISTFDQMNTDLSVMEDLTLTETEKQDLQLQSSLEGFYCQGCQKCLPQCPFRLPIPDIMRAYMYTYSYRNLIDAQDLLLSLDLAADVCGDCEQCPVRCAKGFDISARIRDVVRLREVPADFLV